LLDQLQTGLDIEGMLGGFLGDTRHFCQALHEHVPIVLEEVESSLSYLGSKLALIYTVLARFPASICMALASSSVLKTLDVNRISRLSGAMGIQRLSYLSSAMVTMVVASSLLLCSQSSARCILACTVMIPVGPVILSLR
jgi:hypothetical protein